MNSTRKNYCIFNKVSGIPLYKGSFFMNEEEIIKNSIFEPEKMKILRVDSHDEVCLFSVNVGKNLIHYGTSVHKDPNLIIQRVIKPAIKMYNQRIRVPSKYIRYFSERRIRPETNHIHVLGEGTFSEMTKLAAKLNKQHSIL